MPWQLHRADIAFTIMPTDDQRVLLQIRHKFRVNSEVTVIAFVSLQLAIGAGDQRVWLKKDGAGFLNQ
ncbi:hypothetical protein D3C78_1743320 [compost metagenome]